MAVEDLWDAEIAKRNRAPKEANTVYIGEPNEGESAADMYDLFGCEQMVYDGRQKLEETPEPESSKPNFSQMTMDTVVFMAEMEDAKKDYVIHAKGGKKMQLNFENVTKALTYAKIDDFYRDNAYQ